MATRTLTALFDRYEDAAEAVRQLEAAGVAHGDISIVSNDASHRQYYGSTAAGASTGTSSTFGTGTTTTANYADDAVTDDRTATGTGTGASLGTILGGGAGLLAGLGMLAIPGLGPVVAAGWLASMLVGAGVGAAAGGVVGALTGAGVSETDAHAYAEGVKRGGTLVTVRADDALVDRASDILDRQGTVDMNDRETNWRGEGWSGSYTDPAIDTGSLGFGDADRATPGVGMPLGGGAMTSPGLSPTRSTVARTAAGIGAGAAGVGESVGDAASRVGRKVENAASRVGQSIENAVTPNRDRVAGTDDLSGTYEGTRTTGRGRVRVYDQP